MTDRPELVIDGDGHVIEVNDTYERIDPKYHARRPVYTQASRGNIVRLADGKVWARTRSADSWVSPETCHRRAARPSTIVGWGPTTVGAPRGHGSRPDRRGRRLSHRRAAAHGDPRRWLRSGPGACVTISSGAPAAGPMCCSSKLVGNLAPAASRIALPEHLGQGPRPGVTVPRLDGAAMIRAVSRYRLSCR